MDSKFKKILIRVSAVLLCVAIAGGCAVLGINAYVKNSVAENILDIDRATELDGVDCILILGCLVKSDGSPSDMLKDRLQGGIKLYKVGGAPKILMSGDHGSEEYDEVNAMKKYAIDAGVPSEDIFMDHAGFSTYDSIYRAKEIFGAEKIIIVTQEYHLYRALYIAEELGVEAYGVASDYRTYRNQFVRDAREVLARAKDFVFAAFKPEPTYLGMPVSLEGSGDVTNDI